MKGQLTMSAKERKRIPVFIQVKERQLNLKEAAKALDLSYRQTRRSYKRFEEKGDRGLVHLSRGRPSNRAKPKAFKQKVLLRYQERYQGFGPTLAAEYLFKEGYKLDHETLRRWLLAEGLWSKVKKSPKHRSRREPKAHFGEMVQMDGSHHRWFGPEHPKSCLIVMVDDATNIRHAFMAEEETTAACLEALKQWIELYGIPRALYTDRKNVFITDREPTIEEQLAGKKPMTMFGAACEKLGIRIIPANSPQAKGRVERSNGIYQDRLVKELKLSGVITIDGSNEILSGGFDDELNRKFSHKPKEDVDFHQAVPTGMNLDEILCFEHTRTVANDWTVQFKNQVFQILKKNQLLPKPGDKVTVRILLDGRRQLAYRGGKLKFKLIEAAVRKTHKKPASKKEKYIPPLNHPWRQNLIRGYKTTRANP